MNYKFSEWIKKYMNGDGGPSSDGSPPSDGMMPPDMSPPDMEPPPMQPPEHHHFGFPWFLYSSGIIKKKTCKHGNRKDGKCRKRPK